MSGIPCYATTVFSWIWWSYRGNMPSDPDHVLDAIDGVVEDWESLSADSMRWAPPETTPEQVVEKPSSLPDDLFREVTEIFGPLLNTVTEVLRPLGGMMERALDFLEEPEPRIEVDPSERSCQCLCFRHEDQPGICTGIAGAALDGIPMCDACRTAS